MIRSRGVSPVTDGVPRVEVNYRVLCLEAQLLVGQYSLKSILFETVLIQSNEIDAKTVEDWIQRREGTYDSMELLNAEVLALCRDNQVDLILYTSEHGDVISKLYTGRYHQKPSRRFYNNPGGRVSLDMTSILAKSMVSPPLAGYTLKDAIYHQKLLPPPWRVNCRSDVPLQILLLEIHNKFVLGFQEIASASYTSLYDTVHRGQQVRVWNKLRQKYTQRNIYVNQYSPPVIIRKERALTDFPLPDDTVQPSGTSRSEVSPVQLARGDYTGGLVQEPLLGYHDEPIGTFDFASLYPSILEGYKICHMRLCLDPTDIRNPDLKIQFIPLSPTDAVVLITHYRDQSGAWVSSPSIIPETIREVVHERTRVKKLMKEEKTGSVLWHTLNAKQLGCKVFQNSVYGFFGTNPEYGIMPIPELMGAVCGIGQYMIMQVVHCVKTKYNGVVIYGDTDSVMIQAPLPSSILSPQAQIEAFYQLYNTMAAYMSTLFPSPNVLEFECMKVPFIITGKKNYMALEYPPSPSGWRESPKVCVKGFGFMKRDRCPFVQKVGHKIVHAILHGHIARIPQILDSTIQAVFGKTDYDDFAITCRMRPIHEYKSSSLIQIHVANDILKRTGIPVKPATRLAYVVIHGEEPLWQRGFEINYARERQLPLDVEYYVQKQLQLAILPLIKYVPSVQDTIAKVIRTFLGSIKRKRSNNRDIRTMFPKKIKVD